MYEDDDDEVTEEEVSMPVGSPDFKGTVFIIPLSAPIPTGLAVNEAALSGTLLERLSPLGSDPDGDYAAVALSGSELLDLERPWPALVNAKKVAVLTDLPGATYDILFSQAKRAIGLRSIDWPSVEHAMSELKIMTQRTNDKEPWRGEASQVSPSKGRTPRSTSLQTDNLDPPEAFYED